MKLVSVLSGGLDSTTALYKALVSSETVLRAISFDYGQRHDKEINYARRTANKLDIPHTLIDLDLAGLTDAITKSGSSLVDLDVDVPEGHYAEDNMKVTVVPNRNMVMLSIAAAIAVAEGADRIVVGMHQGDHTIYPDCRPEFISSLSEALYLGNRGFGRLSPQPIWAPFINMTKDDIAFEALMLGIPFHETWSCYKGGSKHCGRCGTCVERLEAIHNAHKRYGSEYNNGASVTRWFDATEYEDTEYWREALKQA